MDQKFGVGKNGKNQEHQRSEADLRVKDREVEKQQQEKPNNKPWNWKERRKGNVSWWEKHGQTL